jgi:hypothetical protein
MCFLLIIPLKYPKIQRMIEENFSQNNGFPDIRRSGKQFCPPRQALLGGRGLAIFILLKNEIKMAEGKL